MAPVTTPVVTFAPPTTGEVAIGVPGSTGTTTAWVVVRAPLLMVTVKLSVVLNPAFCRCACVGV